ncbi:helix-turn-helix domain-containing protein [Zongyangia hominis]|uniref:Helix-turn-helix transcriptional regulator n=1 Tax=Zongyangia hominis TaxID=2763677 RepID=A0A926EF11_9FIRM|nr:helix-turn-helix transcriptional regulator [Zongyangia hominis]MBC8570507.1 helix-turn-helix transcriptional regulator [Zongyangia hominis]
MLKRIKDLRIDHDLTQAKVAEAIGITQRKYSYIETGTQNLDETILAALADFYGVSTDYILGRTNNPAPPKDMQ